MADATPFQTLAELDDAHEALLVRLAAPVTAEGSVPAGADQAQPTDAEDERRLIVPMYPAIAAFLHRGAAAGAFLDETKARRSAQAKLDYWASLCYSAHIDLTRPTLVDHNPALLPKLADELCPYRGLDAFDMGSADVFFGREDQVKEMLKRLARGDRLVVVTGRSGSGKSSLTFGGLLPKLADEAQWGAAAWRILPPFVPGSAPLHNLVKALASVQPALATQDARDAEIVRLRGDPSRLAALLAEGDGGDRPAVLVIDQFEEALTQRTEANAADHDALVAAMLALCDVPTPLHRVVLTMRRDVESQLARVYPAINRRCAGGAVLPISALDPNQLRDAIVRPAETVGLRFQGGVVDELVQSVNGEDAGLPLLQFTLMALWEQRPAHGNLITRDTYRRVGSPRKAMAEAAERLYESLLSDDQTATRELLPELTRRDGATVFRNRVTRGQLRGVVGNNSLDSVLAKFEAARLLRITREDPERPELDLVEVAHEALLRNWERLDRWLLERRVEQERRAFLRKLADAWQAADRGADYLLTGLALQQAHAEFDAVDKLSPGEREFLQASQAAEDERVRQHGQAEAERREFEAQRLALAERRKRNALAFAGWMALATMISIAMLLLAKRESTTKLASAQISASAAVAGANAKAQRRIAVANQEAAQVAARSEAIASQAAAQAASAALAASQARAEQAKLRDQRNEAEAFMRAKDARLMEHTDSEQAILNAKAAVERNPRVLPSLVPTLLTASRYTRPSATLRAAAISPFEALALNATGSRIVLAGRGGVSEWPTDSKASRAIRGQSWPGDQRIEVNYTAYAPKGDLVAIATGDGVWLWRPGAGLQQLQPGVGVDQVQFSNDGRLLAAVAEGLQRLLVWTIGDGRLLLDEKPFDADGTASQNDVPMLIDTASFDAADGKLIAIGIPRRAGGQFAQTAAVFSLAEGAIRGRARQIALPECPPPTLTYAAGGTRAALTALPYFCMRDFEEELKGTAAQAKPIAQPNKAIVEDFVIGANGRQLVELIRDTKEAQFVDLDSGQRWRLQGAFDLTPTRRRQSNQTTYEPMLSIAASGQHVAIAGVDGSVRVFDLSGVPGPMSDRGRVVWVSTNEAMYMSQRLAAGRPIFELLNIGDRTVRATYSAADMPRELSRYVASADDATLTAQGTCPASDLTLRAGGQAIEERCYVVFDLTASGTPTVYRSPLELLDRKGDLLLERNKNSLQVRSLAREAVLTEVQSERSARSPVTLGGQRVFAVSGPNSGSPLEIFRVEAGAARRIKSIAVGPGVIPRFYDDGRFVLVTGISRDLELHDLDRPVAAPLRLPAGASTTGVRVDPGVGLYAWRRPDTSWEIRRLADDVRMGALPVDYNVETRGRWAWGPDGPGRWQFRALTRPDVGLFSVQGKKIQPWFSRLGSAVAIEVLNEDRWLVRRLPSGERVLEAGRGDLALNTGASSFSYLFGFIRDSGDADTFFTARGGYLIDQDGRLIPADERKILDAALGQLKR